MELRKTIIFFFHRIIYSDGDSRAWQPQGIARSLRHSHEVFL